MSKKINTVYLANHSHTDLGFTDHQDVVMRQHVEFIDKAIELCEYTKDYPDDSKYRWTCEVTGITERWFDQASPEMVEKFVKYNKLGQIDVAGMQWNFTPMLGPEQMARSLYPLNKLRDKYGVIVKSAMQSDSNGISWMFADMLPEAGIDFLTMSVNPIRGGVPKPCPQAFWWQGPSGKKILAWNGFHYLFGRTNAKLGDWRYVDRFLPKFIEKLEADDAYPWDFLYCQSTHPIRVDNGPPDIRMVDFVRDWNAQGRTPKMVFSTPTLFREVLRKEESKLPTLSGDWLDWWCDGVASSAYETGLNRTNHSILAAAETIGTWGSIENRPAIDPNRLSNVFELMSLYDEHTWGAFGSVDAPDSLWTKAQWNYKASFAYRSSGEGHDMLARTARRFAEELAERGPEGRFNVGDLTPEEAFPPSDTNDLLVFNTLPWERTVLVQEPEIRAGGAPVGMLETFVPRGIPWGGDKPSVQERRIKVKVPAYGYSFADMDQPIPQSDLSCSDNTIENKYYKVVIDPTNGAIKSFYDKELNRDFAGSYKGWNIGQLIYQQVDESSEDINLKVATPGRNLLNAKWDFSQVPEFGAWNTNVIFSQEVPNSVVVSKPSLEKGRVAISVNCKVKGVKRATCIYWLDADVKELGIEWEIDKEHVRDAEELFIAFPFALDDFEFRGDINGVTLTPDIDQLPGTVRDWFPVRNWIDVSDSKGGVTLAPLDAPLVQVGGITTAKAALKLEAEGPNLMSWALNNHWMVNFKASQGGLISLRYRLTTHGGKVNDAAASSFALQVFNPPVVMRDYIKTTSVSSQSFISFKEMTGATISTKEAADGDGFILRVLSTIRESQKIIIDLSGFGVKKVKAVTALETKLNREFEFKDGELKFDLFAGQYASFRLIK
jgi:hypothetical protein